MSDANRTAAALAEEATFNTVPATPAWRALRVKGVNLTFAPVTVISEELRSDRQITDLIRVGLEAGGDIPMEASYGALDDLIEGAMMNVWTNAPYRYNNAVADSIITDVTATTITFSNPGVNPTGTGTFAVGHLVRTSGFTAAGNNALRRVTAATVTTVNLAGGTIDAAPAAQARLKVVGFQGAAGDITATTVGSNALTSTALDFTTLGLVPGMWLKIGGTAAGERFTTVAANNDWVRVSIASGVTAITATRLELDIVPTGWATDSGATKTISVWMGDYIRNGTTKKSYAIEVQYQDLAVPEYEVYSGMRVGTFNLSGDAQSILQAQASFMGGNVTNSTARTAGSTDVAAPTGDVLNTSSNVGRIAENGAVVQGPNFVLGVNITIDNTLRRQNSVGNVASHGIGIGRAKVSGKLSTYYGNNTILNKIRNGTATSYDVRFTDPNGTRVILVDIPRIKFNTGSPAVPGVDTDRTLDTDFTGLRHPVGTYTIQIQRFEEFQV